jgi:thioredoxin-related protein
MGQVSKKIFFLLFLAGMLLPGWASAEGINWVSYPEGITRAARLQRPVMVFFFSRTCRICSVMEEKVFSRPEIAGYLNSSLVPVRAEIAREGKLVARYRISRSPVIYFLSPDSTTIDFLTGYVEPDRFMKIIRYIGEKAYEKTTYDEYLRKNGK